MEQHVVAQGAGPRRQALVRDADLGELRLHFTGCAVRVQPLDDLCTGSQRFTVGLIRAVQRDRLVALHEHEGVFPVVHEVEQDLTPRRCVGTSDVCTEGERRRRVYDGDHRDEVLDGIVRLRIQRCGSNRIRRLRRHRKRLVVGRILITELRVELAEVEVEEVGDVRVVTRPPQQVDAVEASIRGLIDKGTRLHDNDCSVDVQVLLELSGQIDRHRSGLRQVSTEDIPVEDGCGEPVREPFVGEQLLSRYRVIVVPRIAFTTVRHRARGEVSGHL